MRRDDYLAKLFTQRPGVSILFIFLIIFIIIIMYCSFIPYEVSVNRNVLVLTPTAFIWCFIKVEVTGRGHGHLVTRDHVLFLPLPLLRTRETNISLIFRRFKRIALNQRSANFKKARAIGGKIKKRRTALSFRV